jgi:hypothetical protein
MKSYRYWRDFLRNPIYNTRLLLRLHRYTVTRLFGRWWWIGLGPVCVLIGYLTGRLGLPDWIIALGTVALTLSTAGVMYWWNRRWIDRQQAAMAELAAEARRRREPEDPGYDDAGWLG